jgi:RHS repeat-associated protein
MPGRNASSGDYRYGFNGHEQDDEVKNITGTHYDFGARVYDPRLGKFMSRDPWEAKYAWQTPYAYFKNSPISQIDWKGFGDDDKKDDNIKLPKVSFSYEIRGITGDDKINETLKKEGVPIVVNGAEVNFNSTGQVLTSEDDNEQIIGRWKSSPEIKFKSIEYVGIDKESRVMPQGKIGAGVVGGKGIIHGTITGTLRAGQFVDGKLVSYKDVEVSINISKDFVMGLGLGPGWLPSRVYNAIKSIVSISTGLDKYIDAQDKVEEYGKMVDLDAVAKGLYLKN